MVLVGEFWWVVLVFPCLVGLGGIVLFHYLPFFRSMRRVPKGCMGWPLVGETLAFLKPHNSNRKGSFLDDHCSRYGKVFKSHLFGSPAIVSCDPELNAYVLQNENKLFECSYPKAIHGILGKDSLLVIVGDVHKRLRTQALNLINTAKSRHDFLLEIERNALHVMDSWKDKQQVIFCKEARKFTFNVIVKQMLSLTPDNPLTARILDDYLTFMKGLVSLPLYIPGTPYARAVQARQRILSAVDMIVKDRSKQGTGYKPLGDFLDILLDSNSLRDQEKLSLVLDLLLGGYETTYILLAMIIYLLGDSQVALQELKTEHEMIASTKQKDKHLTWDHYKQMTFTQQVINEALRYGNIVKFVHRKALKDITYKDIQIPKGWKVLPVFTGVHLDESFFTDPLQFNPWRWQTSNSATKQFTPFGGGPRLCPGSELAKVEIAFFIHHFVLNYRWKLSDRDHALAHPYVEFEKGLPIIIESIKI
ncbi:hypothetical protein SUGI_0095430 [Cryptomeria japonica]|nr:hypothetical protein SUGI_0095430 [Cryptomeria japonica]